MKIATLFCVFGIFLYSCQNTSPQSIPEKVIPKTENTSSKEEKTITKNTPNEQKFNFYGENTNTVKISSENISPEAPQKNTLKIELAKDTDKIFSPINISYGGSDSVFYDSNVISVQTGIKNNTTSHFLLTYNRDSQGTSSKTYGSLQSSDQGWIGIKNYYLSDINLNPRIAKIAISANAEKINNNAVLETKISDNIWNHIMTIDVEKITDKIDFSRQKELDKNTQNAFANFQFELFDCPICLVDIPKNVFENMQTLENFTEKEIKITEKGSEIFEKWVDSIKIFITLKDGSRGEIQQDDTSQKAYWSNNYGKIFVTITDKELLKHLSKIEFVSNELKIYNHTPQKSINYYNPYWTTKNPQGIEYIKPENFEIPEIQPIENTTTISIHPEKTKNLVIQNLDILIDPKNSEKVSTSLKFVGNAIFNLFWNFGNQNDTFLINNASLYPNPESYIPSGKIRHKQFGIQEPLLSFEQIAPKIQNFFHAQWVPKNPQKINNEEITIDNDFEIIPKNAINNNHINIDISQIHKYFNTEKNNSGGNNILSVRAANTKSFQEMEVSFVGKNNKNITNFNAGNSNFIKKIYKIYDEKGNEIPKNQQSVESFHFEIPFFEIDKNTQTIEIILK